MNFIVSLGDLLPQGIIIIYMVFGEPNAVSSQPVPMHREIPLKFNSI